jgi:hypothetical protein
MVCPFVVEQVIFHPYYVDFKFLHPMRQWQGVIKFKVQNLFKNGLTVEEQLNIMPTVITAALLPLASNDHRFVMTGQSSSSIAIKNKIIHSDWTKTIIPVPFFCFFAKSDGDILHFSSYGSVTIQQAFVFHG